MQRQKSKGKNLCEMMRKREKNACKTEKRDVKGKIVGMWEKELLVIEEKRENCAVTGRKVE